MDSVNREGLQPARLSIPVPGMGTGKAIGLGSAIKQVTRAFGVQSCGGCKKRASRLDRLVEFRGRQG